jgi:CDP-diglyceride synthetase
MDDERTEDEESGQQREPRPTGAPLGRVRIIGAEPVSRVSPDDASDATAAGTADGADDGSLRGARGSAGEAGAPGGAGAGGDESAVPDLPHWTEAPTGEVPSVLAPERVEGEEADRWASLPAPTWREEESDWVAHDDSFEPAMLAMDDSTIASRHDTLDEERRPWAFDLTGTTRTDGTGGADEDPPGLLGGDAPGDEWRSAGLDELLDDQTVVVPAVGSAAEAAGGGTLEGWLAEEDPVPDPAAPAAGSPTRRRLDSGGAAAAPADPATRQVPLVLDDVATSSAAILEGDDPRLGGAGVLPPAGRRGGRGRGDRRLTGGPLPPAAADAAPRIGPAPAAARPVPPRPRPLAPAPTPAGEGRTGRNLPVAVVAGLVLGGAALLAFSLGNLAAMVITTIVVFLASVEAFTAFRRGGYHPAVLLGWVSVLSLMIATYQKGLVALPLVLVLVVVTTLLWYLGVERGADPLLGMGATLLVFCWIGVFSSFAALLLNPTVFPDRHGIAFLLGAIITVVAYDVAALGVGSWIGSHPMAPSISPKKTWEGAIGGGVAAILAGVVVVHFIHPWTTRSAAVLGLVVAVVAPLGDLFESVVKRRLGLKDMGRLLPGHGGILDRVDGLLFVLPATYYLVKAFNLG